MAKIPKTMRSLATDRPCGPSEFSIMELPVPEIKHPDEVLLKVHAASLDSNDCNRMGRLRKWVRPPVYPVKLGISGSGVVAAIGSGVTSLKVGDEAYGYYFHLPIPELEEVGFCSEYVVTRERFLLQKPANLSHEDAAGILHMGVVTLQVSRRICALLGDGTASLEGKTVFIRAGLGSSGVAMAQLAKNVFGAKKIIMTVSTPKVPLVEQLLPGIVDEVINYETEDIQAVVPKGSVDVVFHNNWTAMGPTIPMLDQKHGVFISFVSIPTPETLKRILGPEWVPAWLSCLLRAAQYWYAYKFRGTGIKYEMVSGNLLDREDLEAVGEIVAQGKLKAVTTVVELDDIEGVRRECLKYSLGKGGLGLFIVKIV